MRTIALKKKILAILSFALVVCFTIGTISLNAFTVKADNSLSQTVTSFEMSEKAGVRLGDQKGMRFVAVLSAEDYDKLHGANSLYEKVEYGYLIMPKYYEEKLGEINEDSVFGDQATYTWEGKDGAGEYTVIHNIGARPVLDEKGDLSKGDYLVKGSVVGMYDQNLATKYTARMYIKANKVGEQPEYKFATPAVKDSSMIDVAIRAMDAGETDSTLSEYITKYNAWYMSANDGVAPTYSYKVQYVCAGEVLSEKTIDGIAINTTVNETPEIPAGYALDEENSTLSGKVYTDSSLVLTVALKVSKQLTGTLNFGDLYYFEKTSSAPAEIVLPEKVGTIDTLSIGETVVDAENFSYDDQSKTLTVLYEGYQDVKTGDTTLLIGNAKGSYKANVTVADYLIEDATDFKMLETSGQPSTATSFNYYVITKDIDGVVNYINKQNASSSEYFRGTLDGKGHVVKNLTMDSDSHALFSVMSSTATLKNIAFVNLTQQSGHKVAMICNQAFENATIDNVFISGVTNTNSIITNTSSATVKISNCIVSVNCINEDKIVNPAITRGSASVTNCYVSSNYTGGVATNATNCVGKTTDNALLDAMNKQLPDTFNSLWSFDNYGNLKFKNTVVLKYSETLTGSKNFGELFYFSKDVAMATGYANEYVSDGNYNVELPSDVISINGVTIAGVSISGIAYANKVLSIPVTALANVATGTCDMIIDATSANYNATVTVADYVLYNGADIQAVIPNTSAEYIVLDGDIVWSEANRYDRTLKPDFSGTLDGKGYTISNLKLTQALFNVLRGATIKDIGVVNLEHYGYHRGVFAGDIANNVTFSNVALSISISGGTYGLVGTITKGCSLTLENTIVYCDYASMADGLIAGSYVAGTTLAMNNSYIVSLTEPGFSVDLGDTDTNNVYDVAAANKCADITALKTASNNLKFFNSDYWTIDASGNICFGGEIVIKA